MGGGSSYYTVIMVPGGTPYPILNPPEPCVTGTLGRIGASPLEDPRQTPNAQDYFLPGTDS